jgi:branched-chain amino acid transport system substrate-binding protein
MELAAEATYERNTKAVAAAMRTLKRAEPDAVVMVGTYAPCAEFIKLARQSAFNPVFVNISFVGAVALAQELGRQGEGVIVSQVVPFPWDASIKVVADYQAAVRLLDPELEPDFVSLEGYLSGRLAAAALELAGVNPTRAGLLQVINEVGRFDISGDQLSVGKKTNGTATEVFLTLIRGDGTFAPIDKL